MKTFLASLLFLALAAVSSAQNTLAGNLTVQQTVKLTGAITPPALTANANDYAPANFSTATVLRLSSDAARTITGLAGGAAGRTIYLVNVGDYPLTFAAESASSTAANRFAIGAADVEIVKGSAIGLWYDATSSRWRPVNGIDTDSGGGGTGTVQSVSVATANGVSGTVASPTVNPVITLSLGAIAPSSVAATGTVTGSNLSGTNTGDMANASTLLKISESAGLPTWNGGTWPGGGGGSGSGTVTSVSIVNANGVSGTVANPSTAPAITLSLGAITPSSVAATGTVTGSNLSGTNTGDQTDVTGNAGTATKLATARTINGVSFDGTANITAPAAAGTLTGATLASNVTASSLTSAAGGTFGTAAFTNSTAYDPAGAAAAITLSGIGGVPTTRTVNGHALSSDITLTASDVGAAPSSTVSFPGFGTTGTTAAVGNDARLSDARTPLAHNQAWSTITSTPTTLSGYGITDAQPLDSDLTSIAALTTTSFGRSLLTQADAAAARTTLGAGTSSFDGTWSSLSGKPTNVTAFGSLANAAGWLYNDGAGVLSYSSPTKTTVGLANVENTALSTWTGSANLATVGTIATGTWHGTAIADTYISSAATWNGKQAAYTNLTSFGSLANSAGWLKNNGSGTLSYSTPTKSDVGLGSVENTALSTWTGSANVTTLGTIGTGTWNATAIADGKIASVLTGKIYNGLTLTAASTGFTLAGGTTSKTLTVSDNVSLNQSLRTTSFAEFAGLLIKGTSGNVSFTDTGTGPSRNWAIKFSEVAEGDLGIYVSSSAGGSATTNVVQLLSSGYMGVGTNNPQRPLHLLTATGPNFRLETSGSNAAIELVPGNGSGSIYNWVFGAQYNYGNEVEITPSSAAGGLTFSSANTVFRAAQSGTIRFPKYGAGTLVTDSSGNITTSSDARLKNVKGSFTRGLNSILQLTPRVYTWKPESGMNPDDPNVGFIAQEVQPAIPEAVGSVKTRDVEETDSKTGKKIKTTKREDAAFLSLSDRPIIAALVNAVKELKAENDDLRARLEKLEGKK